MANEKLVQDFIKALEAKLKRPVQIQVDTPDSADFYSIADLAARAEAEKHGRRYFGGFQQRGVTVVRVPQLAPEYEHDVSLLEGEYATFRRLQDKITRYNVLYRPCGFYPEARTESTKKPIQRAYEAVEAEAKARHLLNLLQHIDSESLVAWGMMSLEDIEAILNRQEIPHLRHNIEAEPSGLYKKEHTRVRVGETSFLDEFIDGIKIADIIFRPVE